MKENFMNWYLLALKKYAEFNGRSRRSEFWYFALFNFLISIFISILAKVSVAFLSVYGLYSLAMFIPSLAVGVRRLHDTGRSGLNLLWGLLPIIGWIILLIYCVEDSKPGENQYGSNPKEII